jgi:hypothetical protein
MIAPDADDRFTVEALRALAAGTGSRVVVDRPMYAVRAGLEVPPELAVFTAKRLGTGLLGVSEIVDAVRRDRPAAIVTTRRLPARMRDGLFAALGDSYRVVLADESGRLLRIAVRSDLAPRALDALVAALARSPSWPRAHHLIGHALVRAGRVDEGLASLRTARALAPRDAAIERDLARASAPGAASE